MEIRKGLKRCASTAVGVRTRNHSVEASWRRVPASIHPESPHSLLPPFIPIQFVCKICMPLCVGFCMKNLYAICMKILYGVIKLAIRNSEYQRYSLGYIGRLI